MTHAPSPSDSPWLSVVLPVHDGGDWLEQTLASAAAEDCAGVEFILYDSSADETCKAIACGFAGRLELRYQAMPHLKSWTAKTNLGVVGARAPHVSVLHQDDLWLPGRIAHARTAIHACPDAVMHLNPSRIIDGRSRDLGLWRCPFGPGLVPETIALERLLVQNSVGIPAPVIRRDAWLAVGGYDETLWYTPDWDLYLKLVGQGPIVYHPKATTAFRVHGGSLTVTGSRDLDDFARQLTTVIQRHISRAAPERQDNLLRTALASARINGALAAAAGGDRGGLVEAASALIGLGPIRMLRYLHASRIIERVLPRLRARLAGSF